MRIARSLGPREEARLTPIAWTYSPAPSSERDYVSDPMVPPTREVQALQADLPVQPLNWIEVGDPPPALTEWLAARARRVRVYGSIFAGLFMGGLVGYIGLYLWSGSSVWPLSTRAELFVAIAIPVGIAEYFSNGWILAWMGEKSGFRPRRVAIYAGNLYLDPGVGTTAQWPLGRVRVSKNPVAAGWSAVSLTLPVGWFVLSFYAPAPVAATIASATGPTPIDPVLSSA